MLELKYISKYNVICKEELPANDGDLGILFFSLSLSSNYWGKWNFWELLFQTEF